MKYRLFLPFYISYEVDDGRKDIYIAGSMAERLPWAAESNLSGHEINYSENWNYPVCQR